MSLLSPQLVMSAVQVFMLALVFLGTLNKQLLVCEYNSQGDILPGQSGCYNLQPVYKWIQTCVISIFIVFWISFVPLFVQGEFHATDRTVLISRIDGT